MAKIKEGEKDTPKPGGVLDRLIKCKVCKIVTDPAGSRYVFPTQELFDEMSRIMRADTRTGHKYTRDQIGKKIGLGSIDTPDPARMTPYIHTLDLLAMAVKSMTKSKGQWLGIKFTPYELYKVYFWLYADYMTQIKPPSKEDLRKHAEREEEIWREKNK
jgi:hypothetical protein